MYTLINHKGEDLFTHDNLGLVYRHKLIYDRIYSEDYGYSYLREFCYIV